MKKRILALVLTAAMTLTMMTGCGTFESSSNQEKTNSSSGDEKTLSDSFTWIGEKLIGMNPLKSNSTNDGNFYYLTEASLIRNNGTDVVPDLAESWDVSDDGLTYTFHLRDSKWSDGTAVTANDFVYAFQMYCTQSNAYNGSNSFMCIKGVPEYYEGTGKWDDVGIKATDDKTLEVTVLKATDDLIAIWGYDPQYPIRQDLYEKYGDEYGTAVEKTGFCGPYSCTEWVLDSKYVLAKNDSYWDAKENWPMKNIEALQISDTNTAVAMFENKEVDAMYGVASDYVDQIKECGKVTTFLSNGIEPLYINTNGKTSESGRVLSNLNFRKALSYAIDRQSIAQAVNKLHQGYSRATLEVYTDSEGNSVADEYPVDCAPVSGDVEQAKQYLSKALEELGYSSVDELPKLTYMSYESDSNKLIGETVIDGWKQNLGITSVEYVQYPVNTAIGNFYKNDYDFFMISTSTGGFAYSNVTQYKTGGDMNMGFWKNDEFNALVKKIENATDEKEQLESLQKAEKILISDAAYCPLYVTGQATACQDYVENYDIAHFGVGYYFQQLKVYK